MFTLRLPLCLGVFAAAVSAQMTQDQKVSDFLNLAGLYAKNYAAYEWKRDVYGFDLLKIQPWLDRVAKTANDLDYYEICVEYVANLKSGGHDVFLLPSTFVARLGVSVDIYDGKVLIDSITTSILPKSKYPLEIGDEIVSVDGKTPEEWIQALQNYAYVSNPITLRRSAVSRIVTRPQTVMPHAVDVGESASIVIRHQNGDIETYTIPWTKSGTPLRSIGPVTNLVFEAPRADVAAGDGDETQVIDEPEPAYLRPLRNLMHAEYMDREIVLGQGAKNPLFAMPPTFVQRLGRSSSDVFYSGTFKADGLSIGYIKIPDFGPPSRALAYQQFEGEIAYFQANTDGLIVDDMRNPGGYVDYVNELVRRLSPAPFRALGYSLRATSGWVFSFSNALESAKNSRAEQWVIDSYQALLDGIIQANSEMRGRTGPLPIGTPSLDLQPAYDRNGRMISYTKPIMVLVDEFSGSGGDAFPTILQDNGRARIFGMRTMGLGGTVADLPAGSYSEAITRVTESLMIRKNSITTPDYPAAPYIENIGVRPDVVVDYMTQENLLNSGKPFVDAFTAAMVEHIRANQ